MSSKNAGRGRPKVDSERVDARFTRDVLNGIDSYAATQPDRPARPEAIRRLVRDRLIEMGHLPIDGEHPVSRDRGET